MDFFNYGLVKLKEQYKDGFDVNPIGNNLLFFKIFLKNLNKTCLFFKVYFMIGFKMKMLHFTKVF